MAVWAIVLVAAVAIGSGAFFDSLTGQQVEVGKHVAVVIIIIAFLVAALIEIWFFLVILHCYRFFRDQDLFGRSYMQVQKSLQIFL